MSPRTICLFKRKGFKNMTLAGGNDGIRTIYEGENFGFSDYTYFKQLHLGAIFQTHMHICMGVFKKNKNADWLTRTYHYFDLHAGPGLYTHNGVIIKGSPIIFAETLLSVGGLKCQAHFFEIDNDLRTRLLQNLAHYTTKAEFYISLHGDHHHFLPCYFDPPDALRPRKRYGLIYADPAGSMPPFELLSRFFEGKSYTQMDVLIYIAPTNLKRQLNSPRCPVQMRLEDYLKLIPKRHWIIREPYGRHQWTFLIGTNWTDFPVFERLGFYRWDSPKGKEIFAKLNYTNEELAV